MALFSLLGLGGLIGFVATILIGTFVISAWIGQPVIFGNDQGPSQPIAFPHPRHVQDLGLDCTFCHRHVTQGAAATIPAVGLCMTCHMAVGDGLAEVEKLRTTFEAGDPIDWVRVHRQPDHVRFVHEAHISFFSEQDGVAPSGVCSTCHGDVGAMDVVKQVEPLKMSQCVDCHRDNGAPTDCTTCHY
ncbi:MAG TPA: molecular chaperone [Dehalococcoidia bacterium]|nr:cytochrome c3 family protein [SAR202 cluster bacterium]HAL49442.1 molecular chaperone [Dehalococcoidia bacterium]